MKQSKKENPKPSVKPKSEAKPKGKAKLFSEEPIVDNNEDEEPNKHELKRRKDREAQMVEHQRIIHEVEEKGKAEREAHATLESRKHLFPV